MIGEIDCKIERGIIDREEGKKKRVIERWKIILKGHHAPSEGVNMRL